uniref:Uncharacterized protein n=1 Tax=Globodera rostochiensis TaxID=31243 RepID=A0A914GPN6_GLORO
MAYSLAVYALVLYVCWQLLKYAVEVLFPPNLRGRCVVCIGSTTGFGHEFVLRCAQEGMTVFAGCNSPKGVQMLKEKCANLPGIVHPFNIDLASKESIERAFEFVSERLPPGAGIHCVMNNAGIVRMGSDDWLTVEDYEYVFRINLFGLIHLTKKFKEHVKLAKGRIVFCSSICGRFAFPLYGPYNVSKFAMEAYCDTIRRELAPFGVHVAIVEPGYFRTPMTTPENVPSSFERSYRQAPAHIREQYGEEFLQKIKKIAHDHLSSPANSPHVEWVTDVYFHAATAHFPKKRYVVGLDANLVVMPIARLPAEVQDFLLWIVGLLQGQPVPAALHGGKNMLRGAWLYKNGVVNTLNPRDWSRTNGEITEKANQFPSPITHRKIEAIS